MTKGRSSRFNENWESVRDEKGNLTDFGEFLKSKLISFLEHDYLNILCGLGTSLDCTSEGKKVAPTMGDLWSGIKTQKEELLLKVIELTPYDSSDDNIEELLSCCKLAMGFYKEGSKEYKAVEEFVTFAENLIVDRCNFCEDDKLDLSSHQSFLLKFARRGNKSRRANLFTTNYDLVFEVAASNTGYILNDGFSFSYPRKFLSTNFNIDFVQSRIANKEPNYLEKVINYYKLHGSIDWERAGDSGVTKKNGKADSPLMIFPRASKYEMSYQSPYLEMITAFQTQLLNNNSCLIICGFGFNDNHISSHILNALRTNPTMSIIIVDPSIEEKAKGNKEISEISKMIDAGDGRIVLLTLTFKEFVEVFPDLVSESEWEIHMNRVSKTKGE